MSNREIAFCKPGNFDVVVAGSPVDLMTLMRNYPYPWERAGNACYFAVNNGLTIGLAAERGTVYPDYGDTAVTARWPVLYVENGIASFGASSRDRAKRAAAAMSAGPMIADNEGILDIPSRIAAGGYTGFDAYSKKPQRAIGITADGLVADGVWESADLYEVAEDMLNQGCVAVMKLDSGGSTGIVEYDHGLDTVSLVWGLASRKMLTAVAMTKVERIWRPSSSSLPSVALDLNFDRQLTSNFRLREFACKGTTCGCSNAVSVSPKFAELVARLQVLRSRVSKPVNVTSGYRCANHDAAVGTSSSPGRGPHTTGTAADIWWDGTSVDQMAAVAKDCGFTGVGRYYSQGFIHVDLRQPPSYFVG